MDNVKNRRITGKRNRDAAIGLRLKEHVSEPLTRRREQEELGARKKRLRICLISAHLDKIKGMFADVHLAFAALWAIAKNLETPTRRKRTGFFECP